ncbi:unnamed protein product [Schistocephalus solidus]|uniref:Filamin/ABP280 repeat protein n=2 Tax=Schistocephalus solidus TaxID=70667 RepID=A0A183SDA6_SCHSO|nr:unnamed protein product [Schistocephalus solidus]
MHKRPVFINSEVNTNMSEQQYARKALEEVIRLADEKIMSTEEVLLRKDEDFSEYARSCDETIKELDQYFLSIMRQLEKWKHVFIQELQASTSSAGAEFHNQTARVNELLAKLRDLRETSAHILNSGQFSNSELVYDVHGCIFNINQAVENLTDFLSECLPLKFVGKLNYENVQKAEIGSMERLADLSCAEILPSKLPKIKLGQLFHLDFRISRKYCEAAKNFITYSVTKDDAQYQKVRAYLQDNKNGSYALSFPITAIIPHTVHILYLGEHIRNSPYTIVFKIGPNQSPSNGGGMVGQPVAGYMGATKDLMGDGTNNVQKPIGRATGDEQDNFRRSKWNNQVDNPQQNNNWSAPHHTIHSPDGKNHAHDSNV